MTMTDAPLLSPAAAACELALGASAFAVWAAIRARAFASRLREANRALERDVIERQAKTVETYRANVMEKMCASKVPRLLRLMIDTGAATSLTAQAKSCERSVQRLLRGRNRPDFGAPPMTGMHLFDRMSQPARASAESGKRPINLCPSCNSFSYSS
jgi:hypothetical protein